MNFLYKTAFKNDVRVRDWVTACCKKQQLLAPSISQGFSVQNGFRRWRAHSRAPGVLIQLCSKSTIYVVYLTVLIWIHPLGSLQLSHVLLQVVHFLIYKRVKVSHIFLTSSRTCVYRIYKIQWHKYSDHFFCNYALFGAMTASSLLEYDATSFAHLDLGIFWQFSLQTLSREPEILSGLIKYI